MDLVPYTEKDVCKVRKYYNATEATIKRDVKILKEWIKQERHLPKNQDDAFLECLLLRNKFRVEQTKQKINGYYTLRGLYREYFQENNDDIMPSREIVIGTPLPNLTPNQERIFCMALANPDPELFDLNRIVRFLCLVQEIIMRNDYSVGDKLILDCKGITFEHLKRFTPLELFKAVTLYQKGYSGRAITVDIINSPTMINLIMNFLKLALPEKLYAKIHFHNDLDSLHHSYSKKFLPKDYGGDLEPLEELMGKLDVVYSNHLDFFSKNYHNVSNEELRISDRKKECGFGVDGTFKKLNLD